MDVVASAFLHRLQAVDAFADDVEQTSFHLVAGRHGDRMPEVADFHAAAQTVCRVHGDGAHCVFSDVLLHLRDELVAVVTCDLKSIEKVRKTSFVVKCYVDDRSDNLYYSTEFFFTHVVSF